MSTKETISGVSACQGGLKCRKEDGNKRGYRVLGGRDLRMGWGQGRRYRWEWRECWGHNTVLVWRRGLLSNKNSKAGPHTEIRY